MLAFGMWRSDDFADLCVNLVWCWFSEAQRSKWSSLAIVCRAVGVIGPECEQNRSWTMLVNSQHANCAQVTRAIQTFFSFFSFFFWYPDINSVIKCFHKKIFFSSRTHYLKSHVTRLSLYVKLNYLDDTSKASWQKTTFICNCWRYCFPFQADLWKRLGMGPWIKLLIPCQCNPKYRVAISDLHCYLHYGEIVKYAEWSFYAVV